LWLIDFCFLFEQPQLVKLGRTLLKEIPIKFAVDDRRRLKRGVFFIFNDIYVIAQETKSSTTSQQLLQLITILPINQTSLQADVQSIHSLFCVQKYLSERVSQH
jgi:ASC-1-like (ASCH) protein